MNVLSAFKPIRAFALDVDGVLTDGTVLVTEEGDMLRRMHIRDGYALQLAINKGYHIIVISGSFSAGVKIRLERLGVTDVHMQVKNKSEILQRFIKSNGLSPEEVLYMGDDVPDMEVMQLAGLPCCPADAVPEIVQLARYISPLPGGTGCVRDVIEKTMKLQGNWTNDQSVPSTL
ncbi:MAG TPA: HAD-IIIA family hydrolase [Ferruginibacter sp.]|nr:HAD-IIIA family hydrolase [Ferruginibacter sp.]HRO07084.1 HAD-IIIA family hydrolase [Ferruginibacter sp.]HRO96369.1 HAD-IIIA family hydrolase [Ferruginibacter sp.]HRP48474.1 HAD-IIIA family hydrolase [Ferruginibacter sp.]